MKKISIGIPQISNAKLFDEFFNKYKQDKYAVSSGDFNFVSSLLKDKALHVGLVSIYDYLKNAKKWHIIQSACISCDSANEDYVLFSKYSFENLEGKTVYIPEEKQDATILLKVILKEKGINVRYRTFTQINKNMDAFLVSKQSVIDEFELKSYLKYDLIYTWQEMTKLPYVLGLWVCDKTWKEASLREYELTKDYLREAINDVENKNISYKFTQSHIESIYKFREFLVSYKI